MSYATLSAKKATGNRCWRLRFQSPYFTGTIQRDSLYRAVRRPRFQSPYFYGHNSERSFGNLRCVAPLRDTVSSLAARSVRATRNTTSSRRATCGSNRRFIERRSPTRIIQIGTNLQFVVVFPQRHSYIITEGRLERFSRSSIFMEFVSSTRAPVNCARVNTICQRVTLNSPQIGANFAIC